MGFEDGSFLPSAVESYFEFMVEAQVTDEAGLTFCGLFVQPVPVYFSLFEIGVNGQVSDSQGRKVLEEVGSLRRGDHEVFQCGFHNHAGAGDLSPGYRNTQPAISGAPAAGAYYGEGSLFGCEVVVELTDFSGDFSCVAGVE